MLTAIEDNLCEGKHFEKLNNEVIKYFFDREEDISTQEEYSLSIEIECSSVFKIHRFLSYSSIL